MKNSTIKEGVVHNLPDDLKKVLCSNSKLLEKWNALTPLARNEWICWTITVKQEKTRKNHIARLQEEIMEGKKRPCCWPGCPHRNEKAKQYFK